MNKMPESIKSKLRKLQEIKEKGQQLEFSIKEDFEKYGVDIENLSGIGSGDISTEAFTYITYAEGDVEESIKLIEEVFLHYANKKLIKYKIYGGDK